MNDSILEDCLVSNCSSVYLLKRNRESIRVTPWPAAPSPSHQRRPKRHITTALVITLSKLNKQGKYAFACRSRESKQSRRTRDDRPWSWSGAPSPPSPCRYTPPPTDADADQRRDPQNPEAPPGRPLVKSARRGRVTPSVADVFDVHAADVPARPARDRGPDRAAGPHETAGR